MIDLVVQYKGHKSQSKFYVSSVGHKAIILGHTWLVEHNPNINWHTGEVKLTCCPDYCRQAKSDSSSLDNNILVHPVGATSETLERIHVMTMILMQLTEAAKGDAPAAKLKEILLKPYLGFQDVFSKESIDELPERKQWDHVIDLKPESQPFSTKVYPMSPIRQKELNDFLKENLLSSHIHPSKSPMASPVFFVKKKDGKLQFVQDYWKLNVMMVKNTYLLPLIPDIINQISDSKARYFTKLDVCWGYNNVRIKEGDKWKATFQTNQGLFEPLVMFFSLTNSPATFQTMMSDIFKDLIDEGYVAVYMTIS